MNALISQLGILVKQAVEKNHPSGLLFSGGLDTSILAVLNPNARAITVSLDSAGEDISYASYLSKKLNLKHFLRMVSIEEAINAIPAVIKILKSFDPALPNDLVVYFGFKQAVELGLAEIATGDGADELFAGYSFMSELDDLEGYIRSIAKKMNFSSNSFGEFYQLKVIQPFLDNEIIEFALKVPVDLKIKQRNNQFIGKWILRKAFEDLLPKEIVWQDKRPLEYGSGMTKLREIISSKISDEEFEEKKKLYPINFLNKEHLYYYEVYRKEVGAIPKPQKNQKRCLGCGAGIEPTAFHCKVCGYVFAERK